MNKNEIVDFLKKAKDAYYNGASLISDKEFDKLEDELRKIDPSNDYFKIVGAPTNYGNKIKHPINMLSMSKVKNVDELKKWIIKLSNNGLYNHSEFVVQPKIDGLSGEICYENGQIKFITTRGDGIEGSDITHVKDYISNIPKTIPSDDIIYIRGEFYLPKNNGKFKDKLRNTCSGLIGRKENLEDLKYVKFIAYQIYKKDLDLKYEKDVFDLLKFFRFKIPNIFVTSKISVMNTIYDAYQTKYRNAWEYETDGLVLVINSKKAQKLLDTKWIVDHHHHYSIALKPEAELYTTKVKSIEWNLSRLGNLIPTLIYQEFESNDGRKFNRCTLNNYEAVKEYRINVDDEIAIEIANDIIPHIVKNLSYDKTSCQNDLLPTICPSCYNKLKREGVHLICDNLNCEEQQIQKIVYWCSALNIKNISESTIRSLYNFDIVKKIIDLYIMEDPYEIMAQLEGFGKRKVEIIMKSIEESKKITFPKFIEALGIPLVGEKAVKKLRIKSLDDFIDFNDSSYVIGKNIIEWKKRNNISDLRELYNTLNIVEEKKSTGKKICMTGTGHKGRKELIKDIESKGDTFMDSISKDLDILLCENPNSGSNKLLKAEKLGIKIMSYKEYFNVK